MKKILSLFALLMTIVIGAKAADVKVTYALAENDAFTSGQSVNVKNSSNETVATITYGESGGADFKAAKKDSNVSGFSAFTEGNGVNGNKSNGTWYTIVPVYDGTIDVAVVLNADKAFHINEDGTDMEGYAGITVGEKYYGTYTFTVKAGSSYKVWCDGSKLGFYGFNYTYSDGDTPVGPVDATFSLSKTALKVGETAKVLVNGSDIYGANFNVPTSLWESAGDGPYISLSADGTVTAVKATPADYCFYFFANSKDAEKYVSKQTTTMYLDITEDAPASEITTESDKTWDINSMFTSNVAATTINDNMEVITTSSLSVSQSNTNFPDGSTFKRSISLKKSSEGQLHIKVAPNSEIIVYAKGGSGRSVKIVDGNENELMNVSVSSSAATPSCFYTGTEDADIYISNGGTSNGLSVFAVKVVPATNIPVALGTNGYSTYCGDENFVVTSGATAYTATLSGTTVTLNEIAANTVIGKGVGIVLVGTQGETAVLTTSATAASSMELGNNLKGVNAETTSIEANAYVLASNGAKTSFVKAGDYGNVTALMNKAYIVYNGGMQEGSLDIQFEGEATAINNVNANDNADSAAPVKVIKNGKLFIGNYNVAGQLVK